MLLCCSPFSLSCVYVFLVLLVVAWYIRTHAMLELPVEKFFMEFNPAWCFGIINRVIRRTNVDFQQPWIELVVKKDIRTQDVVGIVRPVVVWVYRVENVDYMLHHALNPSSYLCFIPLFWHVVREVKVCLSRGTV